MNINVNELRTVTTKLLDWVEEYQGSNIDVSVDYYWNIPGNQVYNLSHEPVNFDVGQISDDWQELRKLLDENRLPIQYQLIWLSALFRAIGEYEVQQHVDC